MNRLTMLIIKTRGKDIKCQAGGPSKINGKYTGWITLFKDGNYDHELLNTESIYDTKEDAINEMKKLVKEVRKIKLKDIL